MNSLDLMLILIDENSVIMKLLHNEPLNTNEIEELQLQLTNEVICKEFIIFLRKHFTPQMFRANVTFFNDILSNYSLIYLHSTINNSLIYKIPITYIEFFKDCVQIFPNCGRIALIIKYENPEERFKKFLIHWWNDSYWHTEVKKYLLLAINFTRIDSDARKIYTKLYSIINPDKENLPIYSPRKNRLNIRCIKNDKRERVDEKNYQPIKKRNIEDLSNELLNMKI